MFINNNATAFTAWTSYTQNTKNVQSTMDRINAGIKGINDDPSSVALSERMRAQISGTTSARSNIDNGMSMIKTSDTWLQKISDMLKSMSSLAVSSNDSTKTSVDRNNAQTEFKEMQAEIVRITSGTMAAGKFNGKALFQSSTGFNIQAGADAGQSISITFKDLSSNSTQTFSASDGTTANWSRLVNSDATNGMSIGGGVNSAQMTTNIRNISAAIDFIGNTRAQIGAQSKRLKMTSESLLQYSSDLTTTETSTRGIDMGIESTNLAKYQIQMNASTAMLAQANQLPSSVLQLLG